MTTPDPAGAGASSSSAPPPPGVARAVTAHPGLLQSNVLRGQFDGFARPGAPASARAAKPKPSDYAPDRRLGLSPALDTPYKRRARRVAGPDFAPLKKEILDRSKGPQDEQIMREWAATEAYARLLDYVQDLAEAVRGVRTPGGTLPKREDGTFRDPVSIVKDDLEEVNSRRKGPKFLVAVAGGLLEQFCRSPAIYNNLPLKVRSCAC